MLNLAALLDGDLQRMLNALPEAKPPAVDPIVLRRNARRFHRSARRIFGWINSIVAN
jgi:hypothetical protein